MELKTLAEKHKKKIMPGESKKPPNHGTYQIWYQGKTHAIDVESVSLWDVWGLTKRPPPRWKDKADITIHVDRPRATKVGDVIIDPGFDAWTVCQDRFELTNPPAPIAEYLAREGIESPTLRRVGEWARDCLEALEAADARKEQREPSRKKPGEEIMKSKKESEGATVVEGEQRQEERGSNLDEAYWGTCPTCHRNDGYLNVGRDHWFVCHAHRVKWCIGSNLFSSWRYESREDWAENRNVLRGYTEIEPEFPAEAGECEPDLSE